MLVRRCLIVLFAGICATVFVPGIDAATRYVSLDGGHDEVGGFADWSGAATTIQAAVNISVDGDVILVSNGVYTATGGQVVRITKSLDIRGCFGRDVTVIDGQGARRGVVLYQTTSAGDPVNITGFTIANCLNTSYDGGSGIYIDSIRDVNISDCIISNNIANRGGGVRKLTSDSQLTLSNCWISHNAATNSAGLGGGVYVTDAGRVELFDCRIATNSAGNVGGGMFVSIASGDILMDGCQVVSNTCSGSGGGVFLNLAPGGAVINRCVFEGNETTANSGGGLFVQRHVQAGLISNCVFRGNVSHYSADAVGAGVSFHGSGVMSSCLIVSNIATAHYGGGLVLGEKPVRCDNLTIAGNHANHGGGGGGLYVRANVTAEFFNCIIYDNTKNSGWVERRNINFAAGAVLTFNNCCTTPLSQLSTFSGTNNFDADPLFIGAVGDEFSYQLQPDSPCINTGTNQPWMLEAVDLAEHARLDHFHRVVDVGCYEYVPIGTLFNFR